MSKPAICYITHDDAYYLAESIASFQPAGEVFVFVSRLPWHDLPGDWEGTAKVAREAGAQLIRSIIHRLEGSPPAIAEGQRPWQ